MGTLHGFRRKSDQGGENPIPAVRSFPELDLEKIKKDLNLAQEGRSRAEKNLPASSSEMLDDVEHKVINVIEMEQRLQLQSLKDQLNTYNNRLSGLDLENEAINISGAAQRASTEFVVKVDDGKAKLFTLWRNVCLIENQWNDFRKKNGLSHPADYPLSRLWNFTIILVILAIESVLNGNFLARGLETGLSGGIMEAFIIAAINVSFGFFIGDSVMRYLFHRNVFMRTLAFCEVAISAGIAVCFNLSIGHYRDALNGSNPAHASAIALKDFIARPFDLADVQSWILFAMGLFFWAVATVDGFKMDDAYPGYGKISRKHEEITQDYTNEKSIIVDDLSQTRDQALDYINNARQSLASRRAEFSRIVDYRSNLVDLFEAHHAYLNRAANDLLSVYRNANLNLRTTPAPAHFNRSYVLQSFLGAVSPPPANNELFMIEKTDVALKDAINQVNKQFEEAVKAFHQIGELIATRDVNA
jgi:hypothetical protein